MIQHFSKTSELGPLKEIPNLKEAIKIVKICYPHNEIQKINPAIGRALNTEELDLSHNRIKNIEPICEMRKLRTINLSSNQIVAIPKNILRLRKLEEIDISFNLLNLMVSINPIIELYKVRKGEIAINLEGNKVMETHGYEVKERMDKILCDIEKTEEKIKNKEELKELEISKTLDIHRRVHSNHLQSEIKETFIDQMFVHQNPIPLSEAEKEIENLLIALIEYERKFEVISASEFKGWNETLISLFKNESDLSSDLIKIYYSILNFVKSEFRNPGEATTKLEVYFLRTEELHDLIKHQHLKLLEALAFCDVPMMNYKAWVQIYREVRGLFEKIRWSSWSVIQSEIRNEEIEALKLISPTKDNHRAIEPEGLEGLLFSKKKEEEIEEECCECFVKGEEVRQLRELVEMLTFENQDMKIKLEETIRINEQLTKDDNILGDKLIKRQEHIIEIMNEKIDASVYQRILLQQAKGIEELIKCDKHLILKKHRENYTIKNVNKKYEYETTALIKNHCTETEEQEISDFNEIDTMHESSVLKKLPYFNKNDQLPTNANKKVKTVSNNGLSTEKKRTSFSKTKGTKDESLHNHEKSKTRLSRKETELLITEKSFDQKIFKEASQTYQIEKENKENANVLISDFSLAHITNEDNGKSSREILAELVNKKCTNFPNSFSENLKHLRKGTKEEAKGQKKEEEKFSYKTIKTAEIEEQQIAKHIPKEYHSVSLKREKAYDDYMRYHLRNSIIETLEKKGKKLSIPKNTRTGLTTKRKNNFITQSNSEIKYSSRNGSEKDLKKETSRLLDSSRTDVHEINKLRY